jgi:hypothetical protein
MDLAERVGWPREPEKWQLLFSSGRGYGCAGGDGRLSAMVVMPALGGASFVAMMVVDPRLRGRGVGFALLQRAMAESTPPLMLYATPLGRALYERLGFREVDGVNKLIGTPRATTASSALRLASQADHPAIVDQDARAIGVSRPRLIEDLLSRAQRTVVDRRSGFAIRWFNGDLDIVGPVVAEHEDAAIALVDGALEGCSSRARVDVAIGSPRLAAYVRSLGFEDFGTAPLMTWPSAYLPGDRARYHAIALQALG